MATLASRPSSILGASIRQDLDATFFSLKCLLAASIALFIALRIGLTHPYWAVTTSYIVANPLAGAVLSKAVARFIGTFVGAAFTVAVVPVFVDAPIALSAVLASWLGLCAYCAILERTPRTYIFVLAGYTASIIGFPSVETPGAIFDIGSTRVQEILIGITCGSLVHALIFPKTVTERLWNMTQEVVGAAISWSRDGLLRSADASARERLQLAVDLGALELLSTHLPFDPAAASPETRALRALEARLILVLPLVNTIENRLHAIEQHAGEVRPDVLRLVERAAQWISDRHRCDAELLIETIDAERRHVLARLHGWTSMLELNLLVRLVELVQVHRDIGLLHDRVRRPQRRVIDPHLKALLADAHGRRLHRDHRLALRVAFGSMASVGLGCLFWIATAWPDGATAVLFAGVCCSFFGNADNPAVAVWKYLKGIAAGMLVSGIYAFAILPRVTDYVMLIAVLAPVLLLLGSLLARPVWLLFAFGAVIGFCNTVGLAATYGSNFKTFANVGLALLAGPAFSIVSIGIFQTETPLNAARRLVSAIWRDVARRARGRMPRTDDYMSVSLDRAGLLAPRLQSMPDSDRHLLEALIAVRIGYVAGHLACSIKHAPSPPVSQALGAIARYFETLDPLRPEAPPEALSALIEDALVRTLETQSGSEDQDDLIALVSLHCNLFPSGPSRIDELVKSNILVGQIKPPTIV